MNVLLIYPKHPDPFWSFKHVMRFISQKATVPPLGLITVSAMLPKTWNKKLVDMNENKNRDLLHSVKKTQNAGLQVSGGFIVGFDTDTSTVFQEQIDFIQQSGIVSAMVGLLNAPKNTTLPN